MRVVFLDFDGVLNSHAYVRSDRVTERERGGIIGLDPDAVSRLNRLIAETGAHVVVSSTWRHGRKRTELCDILNAKGFHGKVLGMTPWLNEDHGRGREIQAWLDEYERQPLRELGHVDRFVILDDDSDMNHLLHRLVKTTFEEGLTDKDVDRAIEMLLRDVSTQGGATQFRGERLDATEINRHARRAETARRRKQ